MLNFQLGPAGRVRGHALILSHLGLIGREATGRHVRGQ